MTRVSKNIENKIELEITQLNPILNTKASLYMLKMRLVSRLKQKY